VTTKFETIVSGVAVSKSMEKEQQHMIPKAYLKSWVCPNPPPGKIGTICVVPKDDPDNRAMKSPKEHFRENDRYTLTWLGGRNLAVENSLGMVEGWFGEAFVNIQARKQLPRVGDHQKT
jgi:hypothetical protein